MLLTILISLVVAIYIDLNQPNTTEISYYTTTSTNLVTPSGRTTGGKENPKTSNHINQ